MARGPAAVNRESPMAQEIEAKFQISAPHPLRRRLGELGARCAGRVFETNHIFDTPDRRLLQADCGLRLRECGSLAARGESGPAFPPALLTYKGPREVGDLKSRAEFETPVEDPAALVAILEQLNFSEVVVYQKRREAWHLGQCEVTLDELPKLGWWVEIEGPNAKAIAQARRQLGLLDATAVRETYVELAATHGEADAGGSRRLVFGDDTDPFDHP